ncbi:glutamine phosphoribosylpyrophosphate amidotransferase [Pelagophyceae sp. CCMP2097]|nr:glutamine phosphoribosylpyrophosphate amidotransferase [Pelagophyceae sp. CCMP2097]|mmetsp:Transcript_7132/g.23191  ORF Transcript_7132/g.23191 Transcript_7132/m.23191 type:complete len:528 (-) Transcript_7132:12-1595(-)
MCGVIAILLADGEKQCCADLVDGLTTLQHRGQDAAGLVTACTKAHWASVKFRMHKDMGLVRDVFSQPERVRGLSGNVGIAHVRYPTSGDGGTQECQPFYVNFPCGLALAHNGNLTNDEALRRELVGTHRHLNTDSDSEVLLNVFAEELNKMLEQRTRGSVSAAGAPLSAKIEPDSIFTAVKGVMRRCRGGYAVVMLIHNVGVVAFRDPWGIRPLVFGTKASATIPGGVDLAVASESVALDTLGYALCRDVAPGEALLIMPFDAAQPKKCQHEAMICHDSPRLVPCIFEYVYFSRPDSMMNGVSVYEAQLKMGEKLAAKFLKFYGAGLNVDVVIAVPDTSRPIALQCAYSLGKPYREGFIKNRYVGRTFIMPGQENRRKGVRMKLNTIRSEFRGKDVLLIDDSIVRGTTSTELVLMAREAGARTVYFVSASPEVRHPNVYGINISNSSELIAHNRTPESIAKMLGADGVLFQDLCDLEEAIRQLNPTQLGPFESSVFNGEYVTDEEPNSPHVSPAPTERAPSALAIAA